MYPAVHPCAGPVGPTGSAGGDHVERVLKVGRVGRLELHPLAGARVLEAEALGVQPLARELQALGEDGIGRVTHGCRIAEVCTRIWCVRPVSRWISSSDACRNASSVS